MDDQPSTQPVAVFESYTHGMRQPILIGRIGNWQSPFVLSLTQIVTGAVVLVTLLGSREVWAHFGAGNLLIVIVAVSTAMLAVRRWRIEGRSPAFFVAGFVQAALRPRHGIRRGQPVRHPRLLRATGHGIIVIDSLFRPPAPTPTPAPTRSVPVPASHNEPPTPDQTCPQCGQLDRGLVASHA